MARSVQQNFVLNKIVKEYSPMGRGCGIGGLKSTQWPISTLTSPMTLLYSVSQTKTGKHRETTLPSLS